AGRPLVAWVYEAARKAPDLEDVVVATDADEVMQACRALGIPAVLTSPDHPSGTDRVWEVAQRRPADVYVNIQGDEPSVTAGHVGTLGIRATPAEVDARQVNKVVFGADGRALYFSKYGIPFDRDNRGAVRYKHVGLYAYTRPALDAFHRLPPSVLERTEGLEQMRLLAHSIPIPVMVHT